MASGSLAAQRWARRCFITTLLGGRAAHAAAPPLRDRSVARRSLASSASSSVQAGSGATTAPPCAAAAGAANVGKIAEEYGHSGRPLPTWACKGPGSVSFDASPADGEPWPVACQPLDPHVEGAFILENVLTEGECDELVSITERLGYDEDAPVSLPHRWARTTGLLARKATAVGAQCDRRVVAGSDSTVAVHRSTVALPPSPPPPPPPPSLALARSRSL